MYVPNPIDTSDITLSPDLTALKELLAKNTHEVWSAGRIEQGWVYGETRSDAKKQTPCLVPYDELPDSEKEYDRRTALETIRLMLKLGYKISRPDAD